MDFITLEVSSAEVRMSREAMSMEIVGNDLIGQCQREARLKTVDSAKLLG